MSSPTATSSSAAGPASTHAAAHGPPTPMMRQYLEAKAQHPDALVLFRMGDFYETFFDDAVEAARILELTLTSRNKKDDAPIPMAGVPHQTLPAYVARLLEAGRKVAICDQVEDPRLAKGIVRREVTRVVTPGLVFDDAVLDGRQNNYLAALARGADGRAGVGLAWLDASTGEVRGALLQGLARAFDELGRIEPAEVLVAESDGSLADAVAARMPGVALSRAPGGPPAEGPLDDAAALLRGYVAATQKDRELLLKDLEVQDLDAALALGAEAVRNLELVRTLGDGKRRGSLLALLDRCRTPMGSRLLKQWLLFPLLDVERIRRRQDVVQALADDPILRAELRRSLAAVHDIERLVTRTVAGGASPRDLASLASSLARLPELVACLEGADSPALGERAARLDPVPEAVRAIEAALVDEPPVSMKDGGAIREGYDAGLDELLEIARDGKSWFGRYAEELKRESGIGSLKIRYNSVFGYFIEVTRANLHHVPETWLRKQTLANAERYYTPELKEREERVLGAHDQRLLLEQRLFDELRARVAEQGARIQASAGEVAALDVLGALAELAQVRGYCRPEVHEGTEIAITDGRHPVIEALVPSGEFVPNDIALDGESQQMLIITGPNMAGKSTVMRQTALAVILAQMGSFVPAGRARIGLADQVFTRVGASDNLTRGESTFMVEMKEASAILCRSTPRSLIILDEIGRGTSTYDGVSIAWAVAEHLHDAIGARTLFATHYHELTELAATRDRVVNMTIAVKEWKDDIVFLRRLVPGGTSRSYGIQVARLAGLPQAVVERAREILRNLEEAALDRESRPRLARHDRRADTDAAQGDPWQLSLFAPDPKPSAVERRLAEIDPDALTPRDALELVYELRELMG